MSELRYRIQKERKLSYIRKVKMKEEIAEYKE